MPIGWQVLWYLHTHQASDARKVAHGFGCRLVTRALARACTRLKPRVAIATQSGAWQYLEPWAVAVGLLWLSLTPSRGCAHGYPMGIALEPPSNMWDQSGGVPSINTFLLRDLVAYPYLWLLSPNNHLWRSMHDLSRRKLVFSKCFYP
jgi:hypothetical protein